MHHTKDSNIFLAADSQIRNSNLRICNNLAFKPLFTSSKDSVGLIDKAKAIVKVGNAIGINMAGSENVVLESITGVGLLPSNVKNQ